MNDYQRISCEMHSFYELAIMRSQSIQVIINGKYQTIQPRDITARSGAEFLIYLDEKQEKQELRVDKVTL